MPGVVSPVTACDDSSPARPAHRSDRDDDAWSPMARLAVGLFQLRGRDWTLGPEFREQVAHYDGQFQRSWMQMIAAHLNQW
jgi:hypothetical protein